MSDDHDPEPLLTDRLVGAIEPATGEALLAGARPGPAGMASVPLAGGALELSLDHAEPAVVTELVVGAGAAFDSTAAQALGLLFGGRWDRVRAVLTSEPQPVWPVGPVVLDPWSLGSATGVPFALQRWAVLHAEAEPGRGRAVVEAVRDLELLVLARGVPDTFGLADPGPTAWRDRGRALLELGPGPLVDASEPDGHLAVAGLVRAAAEVLDERDDQLLATALRSLAADLERAGGSPVRHLADAVRPAAAAAAPMPDAAAAAARPAPAMARATGRAAKARAAEPLVVGIDADPRVAVVEASVRGGHVEVSVTTAGPADIWLRVFVAAPGSPLLVAQSRFRDSPFGTAGAAALLPAGVDPGALLVDVVADPAAPWRSPVVQRTRRAVALGRQAVRRERLGGPAAAAGPWSECGRAWAAVGDEARRATANTYAGGPPRPALRPFATDAVAPD